MTPTYEELLQGATTWRFERSGVTYILSHHGTRGNPARFSGEFDYENHPGTWCYYLLLREQMYPHRWSDFQLERSEYGFEHHPALFDDLLFHGGVTWASSEPYYDRKTSRKWDAVKVGCDYCHLWDQESFFPDTFESVKRDAERTVDAFVAAHPDFYVASAWSDLWGERGTMLEMESGRFLHPDDIPKMEPAYLENGWKLKSTTQTGDA